MAFDLLIPHSKNNLEGFFRLKPETKVEQEPKYQPERKWSYFFNRFEPENLNLKLFARHSVLPTLPPFSTSTPSPHTSSATVPVSLPRLYLGSSICTPGLIVDKVIFGSFASSSPDIQEGFTICPLNTCHCNILFFEVN